MVDISPTQKRRKIQSRAQKSARERVADNLNRAENQPVAFDNAYSQTLSLSAIECAHYIAELASELGTLARQNQLDVLAYLLKMAELEATALVRLSRDDVESNKNLSIQSGAQHEDQVLFDYNR